MNDYLVKFKVFNVKEAESEEKIDDKIPNAITSFEHGEMFVSVIVSSKDMCTAIGHTEITLRAAGIKGEWNDLERLSVGETEDESEAEISSLLDDSKLGSRYPLPLER